MFRRPPAPDLNSRMLRRLTTPDLNSRMLRGLTVWADGDGVADSKT